MDKTLLRSVIVGLTPGQEINVTFRGTLQGQTGNYETVATRRGRGKGGSWLAELRPIGGNSPSDDVVTIGTPKNDDILNVTVDGVCSGYAQESEVPANYETNGGSAVQLKEVFKTLMNAAETRPVVEIVAPRAPEIDGTFTVVNAKQLRGRAGQIVLTLESTTGEQVGLWSYRHSGVVDNFTVVSAS